MGGLDEIATLLSGDPRILHAAPECNGPGNYSVNGTLITGNVTFWFSAGFLNDPSEHATSDGATDLVIVIDVFIPRNMEHVAGYAVDFPLLNKNLSRCVNELLEEIHAN